MSSITNGKAYWRSLDELVDSPDFQAHVDKEFPNLLPTDASPATRRQFLKVMGASLALAGVAGCDWDPRWPKAKILPYANRPDGQSPGAPQHFATSMELGGFARPVLVKSYDGRPIKIEGNPEHVASQGATDLLTQASILGLYDPDRSQSVARGGKVTSDWNQLLSDLRPALGGFRNAQGERIAILSEASSAPSLAEMRSRWKAEFPQSQWYEFEAVSRDNVREGSRLVFGSPYRLQYHLEQAEVIVSLDDDFLMNHPAAVAYTRAFARRRRAEDGTMNRLHVVESGYSITGSVADHRHSTPAAAIPQVAWALAARLFLDEGVPLPASMESIRGLLEPARRHGEHLPHVEKMAKELASHRGHGLVTVGPGQDPGVHALAHVMNVALGNVGHTLSFTAETEPERRSHREAITELCREMNDGGVDLLLILGGNPILDAPADLDFAAALAGVERSVHLSLYRDETSHACTWHVPKAHYLEAWSDSRSYDGTYTIAQPLIEPLFGGKTAVEFLGFVLGEREVPGRDVVRAAYENNASSPSKKGWRKAIHDGFVRGAGLATTAPGLSGAGWQPRPADFAWEPAGQGRTEVVFTADHCVYDGRFANNGWLQELPDVMTKLTWDNAASINPATARDLGVRQGDMLTLRRDGRTLEIPAYLMPGQAIGSIAVSLGYGRSHGGRVAEGAGFDVYPFRTSDAMNHATGVELSRGTGKYKLVTTQDHHALKNAEQGRGQEERLPELFREATLASSGNIRISRSTAPITPRSSRCGTSTSTRPATSGACRST